MSKFPCTQCGLCCTKVNLGKWLEPDITTDPFIKFIVSKFPYKLTEDGSCEMLVDGLCSVYEDRPLLCNIPLGGKALGLDEREWFELSMQNCNMLIREAGLDPKYLVSLEKIT